MYIETNRYNNLRVRLHVILKGSQRDGGGVKVRQQEAVYVEKKSEKEGEKDV